MADENKGEETVLTGNDLETVLSDNPADSIDDTMGAVFDTMNEEDPSAGARAHTELEEGSGPPPDEGTGAPGTPGRDPATGKFTKTGEPAANTETSTGTGEPAAATEPTPAPADWSEDGKALWAASTPEMQTYLLAQSETAQTAMDETNDRLKGYDTLEQILAPRRNELAATFGTTETAVQQLFALSDYANSDPIGFIKYFMNQRGLDPTQLATPAAADTTDEFTDPAVIALQKQLKELSSNVSGLVNVHQQDGENHLQGVIEAFKGGHVHYDAVETDMMALIPSLKLASPAATSAELLQQAYDKAVWSNPTVRGILMADTAAADEAKRAENEVVRKAEADRVAADARTAVQTNVSTTGVGTGQNPVGETVTQSLERAYDRVQGPA